MRLLSRFIPDLIVQHVTDIPLERLREAGVRGLLFDLDSTLLPHYANAVDPEVAAWLESVREQGFAVCVVTNGPPRRALPLCEPLEVPCVYRARKPLRRGLRRALELLGLQPHQVAMVGDQLFTDVWAGRRMGMYTVWVRPESPEEPLTVAVKRPLEWLVLRLMREG
jgi:hypothetical protein